jgi:hypothetical protein
MQFSEDDLRDALKRKDPGPEFTRRVMARVSQPEAGAKHAEPPRRHGLSGWFSAFRLGPALAAAVAVLLVVGAWIGYQSYQQHEREAHVIQLQREAEAKKAQQQTILALRIASEKLNHVFQRVNGPAPQEDKIRRQRL